jgi:flotillin
MQQQVIAEQVKVRQVQAQRETLVQKAEIERHENELIATILKCAEIERRKIETLAAAEKSRQTAEAEAYQEWNQAAVVDKLLTGLPEVVRALSAPLANVDKITIVSTGNGPTAGMSKITGDITAMAAQIPALFETLSGMQMSELLGKVRSIGDKAEKPKTGA